MRHIRREYRLLFWLTAGWLLAAVGANRLFASGLVNYQILYQYVAKGWEGTTQAETAHVLRILVIRLLETAWIILVCRSRFRASGVALTLLGAGGSAGIALVLFTWCRGWMGMPCFLFSGFPQNLFYLAAWGSLILKYTMDYDVRRGKFWSLVLVLLLLGLCAELWINPVFLRFL